MPFVEMRRKARKMDIDFGTGIRNGLRNGITICFYMNWLQVAPLAPRSHDARGTGRFQLFEDAKKRGYGGRSEGAKLRRQNAVRFFEKINGKFTEWGRGAVWKRLSRGTLQVWSSGGSGRRRDGWFCGGDSGG